MDRVGHLLYELSVLEGAHRQSGCDWIDFADDSFALIGIADRTARIDMTSGRTVIREALRAIMPVPDPGSAEPEPALADVARHRLWVELLHDLGLYSADMASLSRARTSGRTRWRYHRIERSGGEALVIVTNGNDRLTRRVDLDAPRLPTAIPIDITTDIATHSGVHRGPAGTPPPRTRGIISWVRRQLRRP